MAGRRAFGVYLHVPWCAVRCGYCDFNTYLPGSQGSVTPDGFVGQVVAELRMARRSLGTDADLTVDTVFFGGGTPTLLPAADLVAALAATRSAAGS
ncbi:MAG: radical SAM protein, partial [Actinomycetes bacterium]